MDQLISKMSLHNCQYLRWSFPNYHGVMLTRVVPARHCKSLKPYCTTDVILGPAAEPVELKEIVESGCGNGILHPDPDTFHLVQWNGCGKRIIGEVICNTCWLDGSPVMGDPRRTALRQLQELHNMDMELKSSYEYEFFLANKETKEPISRFIDTHSALLFSQNEDFLCEVEEKMIATNVDVEHIHSEFSPGQYEMALAPSCGIKSADNAFIFREGIREIAQKHGMIASFMSKPYPAETGAGCHFNHSLWNVNTSGNMFYNPQEPNGMSKTLGHWVAGLVQHSRALTALCSPTVNCYRRLHQPWAPQFADWGLDDRMASYRVKTGSESATYVENRQPSACINSYIVMAATIAAGLDGIKNKVPLPPASVRDGTTVKLPFSLHEALTALEEDEALVEALGRQFVDWFVQIKRQVELNKFHHHDSSIVKEDEINAELKEYFEHM